MIPLTGNQLALASPDAGGRVPRKRVTLPQERADYQPARRRQGFFIGGLSAVSRASGQTRNSGDTAKQSEQPIAVQFGRCCRMANPVSGERIEVTLMRNNWIRFARAEGSPAPRNGVGGGCQQK